jgi:hypothetical protein
MIFLVGITRGVAGAAGSIAINLPAGVQENDVVYAAVASTSTADQDVTETSGTWQELTDLYANDTTDLNFAVYRKVMGASPDASITMDAAGTTANHVGVVVVLRGVDTTTPEDAATTTAQAIDSGTPNNPAITTVTNHAWVLAFAASSEGDFTTVGPAGYLDVSCQNSTNVSIIVSRKKVDTAGAEDPGTYANIVGTTADSWTAATVAVRPVAGGPTNLPEKAAMNRMRRAA